MLGHLSRESAFNEIRINIENSKQLEEGTSNQKLNPDVTKYKIATDNAYQVYIRQKHESLVKIVLCTE